MAIHLKDGWLKRELERAMKELDEAPCWKRMGYFPDEGHRYKHEGNIKGICVDICSHCGSWRTYKETTNER